MARKMQLPDGWQGGGPFGPLADFLNAVARRLNNIRLNGNDAQVSDNGIDLFVAVSPFPWAKLCFGCKLNRTTLTVMPGPVHHGTRVPVWTDETPLTLSNAGANYVYVEYDPATAAAIVGVSSDEPVSDAEKFRVWLYRWYRDNTVPANPKITLDKVNHLGGVYIFGAYA